MPTAVNKLVSAALLAVAALLIAAAAPAQAIVPLDQFGLGPGDQAGLLEQPRGVAVDRTGRVYVSEPERISVYSPQGAFLRAFGKDVVPGNLRTGFEQCTSTCKSGASGGGGGELNTARGIAVDAAGLLYVAEVANHRISVFNQQGAFLGAFGKDVDPTSAETGLETCTEQCKQGLPGSRAGERSAPVSVAIDAAGTLYVAELANNRVALFTRNGTFLRAFGKNVGRTFGRNPNPTPDICTLSCRAGDPGEAAGALDAPAATAVDGQGNVHVSDVTGHRISTFSPQLTFLRAMGEDVVPLNPVTGFEICTQATGCKSGTPGAGAGPLNGPLGIAAADDSIHIVDSDNERVARFSLDGDFLGAFGRDVVPDNSETGFEECLSPCQRGAAGAGPGQLDAPVFVALDCRGALYVAEAGNGRVERFGEPGTESPPCTQLRARSKPFGIMKVRRPRRGTATLIVSIPWSAKLRLRGQGVLPTTRQVEFPGRARLPLRPTKAASKKLRRHGTTRVVAKVIYTPWGGESHTRSRQLVLRGRPAR